MFDKKHHIELHLKEYVNQEAIYREDYLVLVVKLLSYKVSNNFVSLLLNDEVDPHSSIGGFSAEISINEFYTDPIENRIGGGANIVWHLHFDPVLINVFKEKLDELENKKDRYSWFLEQVSKHQNKLRYKEQEIFDKISYLREETPSEYRKVCDDIWSEKDSFVKWPLGKYLFILGAVRDKGFFHYTEDQLRNIREANLIPDKRNNGPAIMSFLLAGGERPELNTNRGWSIHHIYDGNHPWPGNESTAHAVKEPMLFTEAAGLVAIHKVAEACAESTAYFAWLLRMEAFKRFGLDPDNVFSVNRRIY